MSLEDYLKNHNSEARGTIESDTYLYNVLTQFFGMDLRNARTYELDRQVNSLYEAYKRLKAAGKDAEADAVHELIAKVDSARRTEIFYQLSEMDKNLLQQLFTYCSGSDYDPNVILTSDEEEEEEEEEDKEPETDVRSFATDASIWKPSEQRFRSVTLPTVHTQPTVWRMRKASSDTGNMNIPWKS